MPSAERLDRLYFRYAITFAVGTDSEPTDENLKAVLDYCARPAKATEYDAIRRCVEEYRLDPTAAMDRIVK